MRKEELLIVVCLVLTVFLTSTVIYQQIKITSLFDECSDLLGEYQRLRADYDALNSTYSELLRSYDSLSSAYVKLFESFQALNEEVFVLAEDNVRREVWRGFNSDGVGESSFTDYRFKMWINDTSGGWALSKVARGLMPHGWGLRYAPVNEIELTRQNPPNVTLNITLKLVDFRNYTETNSSMNVAICIFFDGYVVDYQEASYQTEIQFFSYYGDRIQSGQTWYFTWRNNSVAQFKLSENLQKGKVKSYELNLTQYILDMMNHYGLSRVKLKHIEIFTEAYKGYSEFELYYAKITASKNLTSHILTVSSNKNYKAWIWNPTYSFWKVEDGSYLLSLNNTSSSQWEAVNLQKGVLPHNWTYLGNPLDTDFELHKQMGKTLLSTMRVKLCNYGFYGEQTSVKTYREKYLPIIKVGIFLWVQIYPDYVNDRQLVVEQVVFSVYRENNKTVTIENAALYWNMSSSDNDFHAQYISNLITQNNTWINLTIDVGEAIDKAFNYYTNFDVKQAKIRAFGFWVEGVYGYATLEVGYLDFCYVPTPTPS